MCPVFVVALFGAIALKGQDTATSIYERGQRYWEESLAAFSTLKGQAPESGYVSALLGEARAEKRNYTGALDAFAIASRELPRLRGLHASIADIQSKEGNSVAASKERAMEEQLGAPNCGIEKLWCDFHAGRFEQVVQEAGHDQTAEHLYWLAKGYRQLAVQTFGRLDTLPESAEIHQTKAKVLQEERHYKEAVAELRAALALKPADAELQRELGAALFMTEDYQSILPELQELLKVQPESANLNFFVGDSLLEIQKAEAAVPVLETALRLDPTLTPAHVALALCYSHLGQDEKALPHLKAGLPLDQEGRLHYLLARIYQKLGEPELAKQMMAEYRDIQTAHSKK
jgi:tetratricopeptide (TPR) repeat protein